MSLPQVVFTSAAKLSTVAVKDGQIIFVKDSKLLYADIDTVRVNINAGTVGPKGDKGDTGPQGATGPQGPAATITIGTVTTGAAGSNASVTNAGTTSAAKLNFTIPRGATGATGPQGPTGPTGATGAAGAAATITIGTVTTGAAGSNAAVTNAGTTSAAKLNFTIPRGATGAAGAAGAKGDKGDKGAAGAAATITIGTVTTGAAGSNAAVTNAGTTSAAKLNFTIPRGATGAQGPKGDTGAQGTQGINLFLNTKEGTLPTKFVNSASHTTKFVVDANVPSGNAVEFTNTPTSGTGGPYFIYSDLLGSNGLSKLTSGGTYTLSFYAKVSSGSYTFLSGGQALVESQTLVSHSDLTIGTSWKQYKVVFQFKTTTKVTTCFYVTYSGTTAYTMSISSLKLEQGNVENPVWTPAPEDMINTLEISKVY